MSVFVRERRIRFSDCDPAGIVFYPQYFVMFNGLVEDWVNDGLGLSYHGMLNEHRIGLPTVHLDVDFKAVSPFGDRVLLQLAVSRLGRSSIGLAVRCTGQEAGDLRIRMNQVIVATSLRTHRPIDIPPELRAAIEAFGVQGK